MNRGRPTTLSGTSSRGSGPPDRRGIRPGLLADAVGVLDVQQCVVGDQPVAGAAAAGGDDIAVDHRQRLDGLVQRRGGRARYIARACAQTARSASPECWIDMLPAVYASSGLRSVRAGTITTRADIDVQLVGDDLGEGGQHALAEFDLAGPDEHPAVGADRQPGAEAGIVGQAGTRPAVGGHAAPDAAAEHRRRRCGYGPRSGTGCRAAPPGRRPRRRRAHRSSNAAAVTSMPGRAVAALQRLLLDEGVLQPCGASRRPAPRRSSPPCRRPTRPGCRRNASGAVDQHVAGPAQTQPAAESGAEQSEVVAQQVEQRRVRLALDRVRGPVDLHPERFSHRIAPENHSCNRLLKTGVTSIFSRIAPPANEARHLATRRRRRTCSPGTRAFLRGRPRGRARSA